MSLQNFSILTYNSNSLFRGDTVKSKILYDESHQIVTCVDTRVSLPQAQRLARSFSKTSKIGERNERIFSTVQQDGERHTGGVLIRFGSNILSGDPEETIIDDSPDKRYMAMVAPLTNGARILICVIYLSPNGPMAARTQLVDKINDRLTDMRDRLKPDVVCITGDLNTSLDNNEKNKKLNTSIKAMLYTLDLEDSFRYIHPSADAHSGATFSCRTSIQQTFNSRLDYVFISAHLLQPSNRPKIQLLTFDQTVSDHMAVKLSVCKQANIESISGRRKRFDDSLLHNENFMLTAKNEIKKNLC